MRELPSGTVTLLFTDIEGSTRLLQALGREPYVRALSDHRAILRETFVSHGGVEVEMQGDSFHFAFPSAFDGIAAAAAAQRALTLHPWEAEPIRVRMGVHAGEPTQADGLYAGLDVHQAARVMSAAHGGQIVVSERTAALVERDLPARLSLRNLGSHRLKDLLQPQRLYQIEGPGLEGEFPPLKTIGARPHNLPVQQTLFLGRERELQQLAALLRDDAVRVVTVTGPGGIGKTRLALQAGAEALEAFSDGVFAVELAALRDPALLVTTLLSTLALRERPGEPPGETLVDYLQGKRILLLLDNLEQLLPNTAQPIAELVSRAPGVALLVTSRAPLRISGEHQFPLSPLTLDEAVALFDERARQVTPGFSLDGDRACVSEICERLDRLPLALELAAARVRALPPRALLQRIDDRLSLLTRGSRDLPERQQTLAATIDWSYELLDRDEQTVFRRLSTFVGGCTLDAAEAVVDPHGALGLDVLDGLEVLIEQSLIQSRASPEGESRYSMLETVREYAALRLAQGAEAEIVRGRHAHYFLTLAHRAAPHLTDEEQAVWLRGLDEEHSNLAATLAWLSEKEPQAAVEFAAAIWRFWYMRDYLTEARAAVTAVLAGTTDPSAARAMVLAIACDLVRIQGDYARAEALGAEGLSLALSLGAEDAVAQALLELGKVAGDQGDHDRARALYEDNLRRITERGLPPAGPLTNLTDLALVSGDLTRAEELAIESVAAWRQIGVPDGIAMGLFNLASARILLGRHFDAIPPLVESIRHAREVGSSEGLAYPLLAVAALAAADDALAARRFLSAAEALLQKVGTAGFGRAEQQLRERALVAVDQVDPAVAAAATEGAEFANAAAALDYLSAARIRLSPCRAEHSA